MRNDFRFAHKSLKIIFIKAFHTSSKDLINSSKQIWENNTFNLSEKVKSQESFIK